jgi:hypothetical protein
MIEVEGLTKYYGNVSALKDVTFFISASGGRISLHLGNEVPQQKAKIYAQVLAENRTYIIEDKFLDTIKQYLREPQ